MKILLALVLPALAAVVFFQMGLIVEAVAISAVMAIVSMLLATTESPKRH